MMEYSIYCGNCQKCLGYTDLSDIHGYNNFLCSKCNEEADSNIGKVEDKLH